MNLLIDKIKNLYFRYLFSALGSALITSIYSIVDCAMVGQYEGPNGTAALATVMPLWSIIISFGILTGIGGSVLYSLSKGKGEDPSKRNQFFTVSIVISSVFALVIWMLLIFLDEELLRLFGATDKLLPLATTYLTPIKFIFPCFLFDQVFAAFLRNDNNPALALIGVLAGGVFNMVGDYLFVFTFDMGIFGAGLATAIGGVITTTVMAIHFFLKKNTIRLVKVENFFYKSWKVLFTGFPTFFVDFSLGVLTMLFNNQIMFYLGTNALAVYGVIMNINMFVQCSAYSVGQAAQPIISTNYGAKNIDRIKETLRYSLISILIIAVFWVVLSLAVPNAYIYIFMTPTEDILTMASPIIRIYSLSFLLMPLNVFSTYYFQAILKPRTGFIISTLRSLIFSVTLLYILPLIFGGSAIWYVMLIVEILVAIVAVIAMVKATKNLNKNIQSN